MDSSMASMPGMQMSTATATASAAAAAATGSTVPMGGMSMGGDACKISMLWNWYTVDACFLARTWRITSRGMFAGSCIGVILLVMVLEALRRAATEYDAFLVRKRASAAPIPLANEQSSRDTDSHPKESGGVRTTSAVPQPSRFTPNVSEQLVRALLHMLQFAVAYFVMLLAMYFNGYIIICIFIGAFLGAFLFNWTSLGTSTNDGEITFCCG